MGNSQTNQLFVSNRFQTKRRPVGSFKQKKLCAGGPTYQIRSHAMKCGSGGNAMGSVEQEGCVVVILHAHVCRIHIDSLGVL